MKTNLPLVASVIFFLVCAGLSFLTTRKTVTRSDFDTYTAEVETQISVMDKVKQDRPVRTSNWPDVPSLDYDPRWPYIYEALKNARLPTSADFTTLPNE